MSDSFALCTATTWGKNDIRVIEYGGKIWINPGHLQEKIGIANIAGRTLSIILTNFKKWYAKNKSVVNISLVESLLKILWQ